MAATIQAIGRCATNIGRVRDTCLNGLVQLLSNRDGQCVAGRPAPMSTGCLPACPPHTTSRQPLSVQAQCVSISPSASSSVRVSLHL